MTDRLNDPTAMTDIEPLDSDIELITRFLSREMSEEEMDALENRMADDAAFYEKVAPIMKIWFMPVHFGSLLERYRAGELGAVTAPAAASATVRAPAPATEPEAPWVDRAPQRLMPPPAALLSAGKRLKLSYFGTGIPAGKGTLWKQIKYGSWVIAGFFGGVDRREGSFEPMIDKSPFWSRTFNIAQHAMNASLILLMVLVIPASLYLDYKLSDDGAMVRRLGRFITRQALPAHTVVRTAIGQDVAITVPGGARMLLREQSKAEWPAGGTPVTLTGAAVFEVPASVTMFRVLTRDGEIRMGPGRYAISPDQRGEYLLVSVAAGLARIRADTTKDDPDHIPAGGHGYLYRWKGTQRIYDASRAVGYPTVPSPLPWEAK